MVRTLVIACAALTRELRELRESLERVGGGVVHIEYLPSPLHNRPERIPAAVEAALEAHRHNFDRTVLAYGDCGTGGLLDRLCERHGIERLPGAHCYEFFAGSDAFAALHEEQPGTFYLTDYLAKHFDALVMAGLGLDRHPELRDLYFGNYARVVLLSQSDDPAVVTAGKSAAEQLGLAFEHRHTSLQHVREALVSLLQSP